MDTTSIYAPSSASGPDISGRASGSGASNDLEALFDSMLQKAANGSTNQAGQNPVENDLVQALQSLAKALEDALASGQDASSSPASGSGAPGATSAAPTGLGTGAADPAASTPSATGVGNPPSGGPSGTAGDPAGQSAGTTADGTGGGSTGLGASSTMPSEATQPGVQPQVTSSGMSAGKTQVYDALKQQGATPQEIAQVMGMGMVETDDFNADQRDASKDGTASANYSAFNLNEPELQKLGYTGDPSALNNQNNIGQVADLLLNGIRQDGFNDVAGMTRDSVNFDPGSSDIQQWDAARAADANQLLQLYQQQGTQAFTDDQRVATSSPYI